MEYKHSYVVDVNGYCVGFVRVQIIEGDKEFACYRDILEGEVVIDVMCPAGLVSPRWNGAMWDETATPEEIAAAEAERAAMSPFRT